MILRPVLVLLLLFFALVSSSFGDTLSVSGRIIEAVVYRDQAQITVRTAEVKVPAGEHQIVVRKLFSQVDARSLQVRGVGEFTILGARPEQDFAPEPMLPPVVRLLKDSADELKADLDVLIYQREVYLQEEQLLLANKQVGGANTGLNVTELARMADFFRQRMLEVKTKMFSLEEKIRKAAREYEAAKLALDQLTNKSREQASGVVVVSVRAAKPTTAVLTLTVLTPLASWYPVYDLRGQQGEAKLQLVLKAEVRQATGQDWQGVKLAFSSGQPGLGAQKPELRPLVVDVPRLQPPVVYMMAAPRATSSKAKRAESGQEMTKELSDEAAPQIEAGMAAVAIDNGGLNLIYSLEDVANVPSRPNATTTLELNRQELPAVLQLACAPALDQDVFAQAIVRDWAAYNLLPGPMNVFYDGVFTGEAQLPATTAQDSLVVSLGRDRRVLVRRQALPQRESKSFLGGERRKVYAYLIDIKNQGKTPITLRLEDRLPVSRTADIKVEAEDLSGGRLDASTGQIRWDVPVGPALAARINLRYVIKYANGKPFEIHEE